MLTSASSVVVMAGRQKSAAVFFYTACKHPSAHVALTSLTHTHANTLTPLGSLLLASTPPPQRRRFSARSQPHQSNAIGLKHKWTRHCFCWLDLLTPPPVGAGVIVGVGSILSS